jgi:hypothetical protein
MKDFEAFGIEMGSTPHLSKLDVTSSRGNNDVLDRLMHLL